MHISASLRDILNPTTPELQQLRKEVLRRRDWKDIIQEVLQGLAYINSNKWHSNNISHRDVKPENIIVVRRQRDGALMFKFTDFDSAKILEDHITANVTTGNKGLVKKKVFFDLGHIEKCGFLHGFQHVSYITFEVFLCFVKF